MCVAVEAGGGADVTPRRHEGSRRDDQAFRRSVCEGSGIAGGRAGFACFYFGRRSTAMQGGMPCGPRLPEKLARLADQGVGGA